MNPSICFIIPYFGKWPFWFPFFLASCRANSDINWILYSDCEIPANTPDNVRIIYTDYPTYCERISESLGISFQPSSPYKLCDIKPALGHIHKNEIAGFDFWAFGDIDLVYGDLRHYFTKGRLGQYDIFSTHERRISGHCCLLRNTPFMREAFMHVKDWKQQLSSPQHKWFDESAFSHLFIRHKNWPKQLAKLAKPFNRWARCIDATEGFTTPYAKIPWLDGTKNYPREWRWIHGRLTNNANGDRQFPYFHFVVWKKNSDSWNNSIANNPLAARTLADNLQWAITENGFETYSPNNNALLAPPLCPPCRGK